MLNPNQMFEYQKQACIHQMYNDDSMVWLGMGLGKTVITLTTIDHRMKCAQVQKTLIFGPLRVIHAVWEREARKWEHTKHLTFSMITGTPTQRKKALFSEANIYLCNYENMNWLAEELMIYYVNHKKPLPFQMVVYDEVSKLKNSSTVRMKGGKREKVDSRGLPVEINIVGWNKVMNHFDYRTGLTGTPASNGYIDLFGQFLAVDGGERLGKFVTHYRDAYFQSDHMGWTYSPTEEGKKWIEHKLSDITIKMDANEYLDMPEVILTDMYVDLPKGIMKKYKEVEKQMFTELDSGTEVEVFSASSISNKCLQFANGSPYVDLDGNWEPLHDVKLNALEEVMEEAAGKPVLCSYSFRSDAERILKKFKKYKPVNLTAIKSSETESVINDWDSGRIKLLIGHPASIGHGIDGLQQSGNIIVWFGINWSLELYDQLNGRINRTGQTKTVSIIRILCRDTVDVAVLDSINNKNDNQQGLKESIQRYREGRALQSPLDFM